MTLDRRTFVKGALGASGAVLLGAPVPAAPGPGPGPLEPPRRVHFHPVGPVRPPATGEVRDRARDRRDDGEPQLRPLPRAGCPTPTAGRPASRTTMRRARRTPRTTRPSSTAAASPTPTTPMGEGACSTTAERWTASSRHGQRHLRRQLLHGQGPTLHEPAGPGLHDLRPLLLLHPGPDLSQSFLPARRRRPTGSTTRSPSRTLPTIWDQLNHPRRADRPLLLQRRARSSRSAAAGICRSPPRSPSSSPTPRPGRCPTSPSWIRSSLGEGDGTSTDDHPLADIRAGDAFLSQVFHAVAVGPGLGQDGARHQLRRVGRLLRPRAPRRITPGVPLGAQPSPASTPTWTRRARCSPDSGCRASSRRPSPASAASRRRGQPRLLRPHLGAQTDRVALGPAADHPARCVRRPDRPRQPRHRPELHQARSPRCPSCPYLPPFTPTGLRRRRPPRPPPPHCRRRHRPDLATACLADADRPPPGSGAAVMTVGPRSPRRPSWAAGRPVRSRYVGRSGPPQALG